MLAVKRTEPLFAWSATHGFGQHPAHQLLDDLDPADWLRLSAEQGAKGRLYDWARVGLYRFSWPSNVGFWLLARRSISDPDELAQAFLAVVRAGVTVSHGQKGSLP